MHLSIFRGAERSHPESDRVKALTFRVNHRRMERSRLLQGNRCGLVENSKLGRRIWGALFSKFFPRIRHSSANNDFRNRAGITGYRSGQFSKGCLTYLDVCVGTAMFFEPLEGCSDLPLPHGVLPHTAHHGGVRSREVDRKVVRSLIDIQGEHRKQGRRVLWERNGISLLHLLARFW
jgi:hypothetical protein